MGEFANAVGAANSWNMTTSRRSPAEVVPLFQTSNCSVKDAIEANQIAVIAKFTTKE